MFEKSNYIETPTLELAEKYIRKFKDEETNAITDLCIKNLFDTFNQNDDIASVLTKVTVLNEFYHTRILSKDLITIAEHIVKQNIDDDLMMGLPDAVEKIVDTPKEIKKKPYSFATKYCNWHNPHKYPIVDRYVKGMLYYLNKSDNENNVFYKEQFCQNDLNNYKKYCEIYDSFIKKFKLGKLTYKKIDMYLWKYGKDVEKKKKISICI